VCVALAGILLAIPIDAARVRLCYPHRVKAGTVANKQLASLCLMFDVNQAAHRTQVENLWKRYVAGARTRERRSPSSSASRLTVRSVAEQQLRHGRLE
jgi:hypothetical protein